MSVVDDLLKGVEQKSEFDKVVKELTSDENLLLKTELSKREINKLALLLTISKKYKFDFLEDLIILIMKMRVSIGRKGRKEIVEIAKGIIPDLMKAEEEDKDVSKK